MNPSIVIVRIVRGNQLLIQVKDLSRPAPTAVELCIGMFVGNAQTVEKKLTLTKTIMIVLSKVNGRTADIVSKRVFYCSF